MDPKDSAIMVLDCINKTQSLPNCYGPRVLIAGCHSVTSGCPRANPSALPYPKIPLIMIMKNNTLMHYWAVIVAQ